MVGRSVGRSAGRWVSRSVGRCTHRLINDNYTEDIQVVLVSPTRHCWRDRIHLAQTPRFCTAHVQCAYSARGATSLSSVWTPFARHGFQLRSAPRGQQRHFFGFSTVPAQSPNSRRTVAEQSPMEKLIVSDKSLFQTRHFLF